VSPGPRVLIAGGPRVGKTYLAEKIAAALGVTPKHTDDLIATHDWSEASAEAARWIAEPGPWVVEGVAVPRAIRKWMAAHPVGKPADVVHWGIHPREPLIPGQLAMLRGCETVFAQVREELLRRGVQILPF